MKTGDLVRYASDDTPTDDVVGLVISTATESSLGVGEVSWAAVIWSLESGPHHDAVPLTNLEVINESR